MAQGLLYSCKKQSPKTCSRLLKTLLPGNVRFARISHCLGGMIETTFSTAMQYQAGIRIRRNTMPQKRTAALVAAVARGSCEGYQRWGRAYSGMTIALVKPLYRFLESKCSFPDEGVRPGRTAYVTGFPPSLILTARGRAPSGGLRRPAPSFSSLLGNPGIKAAALAAFLMRRSRAVQYENDGGVVAFVPLAPYLRGNNTERGGPQ